MRKLVLLLFASLFCAFQLSAQRQQITGTVTGEDGAPLYGVTVFVVGTTTGVSTGQNGSYTINAPANGTLRFSFLGTQTQEIQIGGRTNIDVVMLQTAENIDPLIVVAYGQVRKETFTGSAGIISEKQLDKRTVTNITKALEGTTPGLMTTSGSGQPGDAASIRIRGFGSINSSNDPLIVVDGVPFGGTLSSINPDDIASITVLKDAAAGALYGARGANGVVMINTKRGLVTAGAPRIEFKANWGITSRAIPKYETLGEKEYLEENFNIYKNMAIYEGGVSPDRAGWVALGNMFNGGNRIFGTEYQFNPYDIGYDPALGADAQLINPLTGLLNPNAQLLWSQNWLDESMRDTPFRHNYNVSISGGTDRTQYFTSVSYVNEQGLMQTTSFERMSANLSLDTKLTNWMKLSGSMSYSNADQNYSGADGLGYGNVWYTAQHIGPIYPVYETDPDTGKLILDDNGKKIYDWSEDRPQGASANFNAPGLLHDDAYFVKNETVRINGTLAINFDEKFGWAEGLFANITYGGDIRNQRQTTYYNPYTGNARGTTAGRLTKWANRNYDFTFTQILGYNRTFGDHTIFGQVGHEFYEKTYNFLTAQKTGFPFGGILELGPGVDLANINSYEHKYAIESVFAQVKYSFRDKYNLDASFRTDGSSRFHKDHRWGNFWSVGGNWRISEEDFMQPVNWVNNLSVRASYGIQGNDALLSGASANYYAWQSFYTLQYGNAGNNAAFITSLENSTISWEKSKSLNIGVEGRLFNRLNLTLEFFNRKTTDLLLNVPMALSTGFQSYDDNVGDVQNRGFEYSIAVDIFNNQNFRWRFTTIGTVLRNKILRLASDTPIISGNQIYQVGKSMYSYFLPESAGVDPATGRKLYYAYSDVDANYQPTENAIRYVTDDTNAAAYSRVVGANSIPKLEGSFGSEFTIYNNLDISFLATYGIGGKMSDGQFNSLMTYTSPGAAIHKYAQRAWKNPGDITDVPRLSLTSTDRFTHDQLLSRSYLAIKNITVGYTFNFKTGGKKSIDSLRVYATADNLHFFTALKGFNPTSGFSSVATYSYVPIRTFSLGVHLTY